METKLAQDISEIKGILTEVRDCLKTLAGEPVGLSPMDDLEIKILARERFKGNKGALKAWNERQKLNKGG